MSFVFEQHIMGGDRNFGYLIGDTEAREAVVIDPSYAPEMLLNRAEAQGLTITAILNTHGHFDHTNGNEAMQKATGAPLFVFPDLPDAFSVGKYPLEFFHTPGHAEDHIVIYQPHYQIALTGDHLFVGKIGGTGSEQDARTQYESFQLLFETLPLESTIWPGHNVGARPSSTLKLEIETNPFLKAESFEEFLSMKVNWRTYKGDQGLL